MSDGDDVGLRQEARGDAVVLTLDRPGRRNALTPALAGALGAAVEAAPDMGARVIVVTGAGGAFCAGGDLDALEAVAVDGGAEAVMTAIYGNFHRLALAVRRSPLPVLALVDGPALGAGLDLALVCDLRVGTSTASFASSWIRMGLVPGMGGAYLLPAVVGAGPAAELLLTGATVDAGRALAIGLLSSVDEAGEVWSTVDERVAQFAALPAVALAQTKASLRRGTDDGYERELATLGATQGALLTGPAFRATAEAFRSRVAIDNPPFLTQSLAMDEVARFRVDRRDGEVAVVTFDRPERMNALDDAMVWALPDLLGELGADPACRVVVLTGAGRAFCAGMDMGAAVGHDDAGLTSDVRFARQERFSGMIAAIRALPQPVIAAVNGPAAGSGMGIALAADIRVAATSASFHVAAVKLGLSAGECGISYHLPRSVGMSRAMEIMLTGRPVGAEEAAAIGLVSRVVPDGEVLDAALEIADAIVGNSPFGVRMTKRVAWANADHDLDAALALENRTQIIATMTPDSFEAKRAFVEKRTPRFGQPS